MAGSRFLDSKPDSDGDDPASLIPMSVMCSNGGKRGIAMAHSFIENSKLKATRVHPKPCTIILPPYGRLNQTRLSRPHSNRKSPRGSLRRLHRWKTSRRGGPPGCLCVSQMTWMRYSKKNWR